MAKPNYSYEKRQRELEKKKKKAEKALRKSSPGDAPSDEASQTESAPAPSADTTETPEQK